MKGYVSLILSSMLGFMSFQSHAAAGDYFVFDMVNQRLTHWSIVGTPDSQHMTLVANSSQVTTQFNQVQQLYNATKTLNFSAVYNVSNAVTATVANPLHTAAVYSTPKQIMAATGPGMPESAFDLVNTPANQSAALTAYGTETFKAFGSYTEGWLATFTTYFTGVQALFPLPVIIDLTLQFSDGSTATWTWDPANERYVYVPGSGKDAIGNPIPESPAQVVGSTDRLNYIFPNTAAGTDALVRQLQNFNNIGVPAGAPVTTSTTGWGEACVRVGGPSGTVSCTPYPL